MQGRSQGFEKGGLTKYFLLAPRGVVRKNGLVGPSDIFRGRGVVGAVFWPILRGDS